MKMRAALAHQNALAKSNNTTNTSSTSGIYIDELMQLNKSVPVFASSDSNKCKRNMLNKGASVQFVGCAYCVSFLPDASR